MKPINFASGVVLASALFVSVGAQAAAPYSYWNDDHSVTTIAPVSTYSSDDDTTTTITSSDDHSWYSNRELSQWFSNQEDNDSARVVSLDDIDQRGNAGLNSSSSNASSNPFTYLQGGPTRVDTGDHVDGVSVTTVTMNPINNLLAGSLNGDVNMINNLTGIYRPVSVENVGQTIAETFAGVSSSSSADQIVSGPTDNSVVDPVVITF